MKIKKKKLREKDAFRALQTILQDRSFTIQSSKQSSTVEFGFETERYKKRFWFATSRDREDRKLKNLNLRCLSAEPQRARWDKEKKILR